MTLMTDLLNEVMDRDRLEFLDSDRTHEFFEDHDCDGCGQFKPKVDLWAEDSETGEELWLCETCCDW